MTQLRLLVPALAVAMVTACGAGAGSGAPASPAAGSSTPASPVSPVSPVSPASPAAPTSPAAGSSAPADTRPGHRKVMVVVEENEEYGAVMGAAAAPYLNGLARDYGTATAYDAGYPASCPSLAGYLLLTSGSTHGICDDDDPSAHPIAGDNLFRQVAAAGQEWRVYAQSMPAACTPRNDGPYLVRHTGAPYYLSERDRCSRWDVPLGSFTAGALHDDVTAGRLPAFSLVVPDACNDMHGGHGCPDVDLVGRGDAWLGRWLPQIMAAPDYRAGRLAIIVTWDESSSHQNNHIPTLVISPTTRQVVDPTPQTHCTTLRTVEDLLHLAPLGCAAGVAPATARFRL